MKSIKLFLVTAVAVLVFAPICAKNGRRTLKEDIQLSRKAKRAATRAGIKKSNPKYNEAISVVSLLGPLGVDKTLIIVSDALREGIITAGTANRIMFQENGRTLAHFFGLTPTRFMELAKKRGVFDVARRAGTERFEDGFPRFATWVKGAQ